ncbi:MAG: hypothetical protein K2J20_02215 [Bacilli bacterium]|nr:hypothetical protein [Bacilli bacterium]
MDFLNKLYESNYFGIGLFAVISFLVVTFLVVLFFGKRDEHKRNALDNNNYMRGNNNDDAFKETSVVTPVEVPVPPVNLQPVAPVVPMEPVAPLNFEEKPITPVVPVSPIVQDVPIVPVVPQVPVAPVSFAEPITPVSPVSPIVQDVPIAPVVPQAPVTPVSPVIQDAKAISEPVIPVINEPVINPIPVEPVKFNIPPVTQEPKVMEPIRITIPKEPVFTTPIIQEEVKTIITPTSVSNEPRPIIEEPTINDTYYSPVERIEPEEVKVPNIDFDAITQSISKELDELEKSTPVNNTYYDQVKVTPINEIARPSEKAKPSYPTRSQFSSVYVTNASTPKPVAPVVDLPKKIDLPTKKID